MAQTEKLTPHHTTINTEAGVTTITCHGTEIVQFDKDIIVLNSGGYRTKKTKDDMNRASRQYDLGYRVFQENKIWYVKIPQLEIVMKFYDNMALQRLDPPQIEVTPREITPTKLTK